MTEGRIETSAIRRRKAAALRSPILRKILISLAFWFLAFTVTGWVLNTIGKNTEWRTLWSFSASFFIAGVILVVQFLLDVEHRMVSLEEAQRAHAERTQQQITDGISKINEATELFGQIEASAVRTDAVTQLVRHSTKIAAPQPDLVVRFAQGEIGRMSQFLKELGEGGEVTYEGEDRDWMLGLARQCQTSIDATSLTTVDAGGHGFVDGGLWSSDLGQRYLDVQREAIARGVTIRRVFIMDRPELLADPGFRRVCAWHKERKIVIKVLDPSSARNAGTPRSSLFDFIVFDGVVSYEAQPASQFERDSTPVIINTRLVLRQDKVNERMQRFEDLWRLAVDFE
jgi:hypothetical protein